MGDDLNDIPKSLRDSYAEARDAGVYSGSLLEWTRVSYLLFRLSVQDTGREPASYTRWMHNLRLVDESLDSE